MSDFNLTGVVRFAPELAPHFESLNREWIEQYFEIEEADRILFCDPYKEIVEPGGQIFFVIASDKVVGTCAVMRHDSKVYELGKMAVSRDAQGHGYGDLLMKAAIDFAKQAGCRTIVSSFEYWIGASDPSL